jgi:endonuclease/exonuclease/phosphatase family metal-dependent hydrolase
MTRTVFAVICSILLAGCATTPMTKTLRVMTYNIHHAEGVDGKIDLERIARLITDSNVDLVALQEVDRNTRRTGGRDMPRELAKLTGMRVTFGANIPLEGGEYGNAILSRHPFDVVANHQLPKIVPGEQRGMLEVIIHAPGGPFRFCATHLDHRRPEEDRLASVEYIAKALADKTRVVLAGDFNARPDSETYRRLGVTFVDAWTQAGQGDGFTIPSESPRARIDYVWLRGFTATRVEVLPSNASDHLPLIVDIDLTNATRQPR